MGTEEWGEGMAASVTIVLHTIGSRLLTIGSTFKLMKDMAEHFKLRQDSPVHVCLYTGLLFTNVTQISTPASVCNVISVINVSQT